MQLMSLNTVPKPYFVVDSWLEKKVTIPYWSSVFKSLEIYNEDYHEKYRKYIHSKRYKVYINKVAEDMYNVLWDKLIQKRIERALKEEFPEPVFLI